MRIVSLFCIICLFGIHLIVCDDKNECKNIDSDYSILYKLIKLEENVGKQEKTINEQRGMIDTLSQELKDSREAFNRHKSHGATYIRWGRTTCPSGAEEVYKGYAAGSHYSNSGGAANLLCLTETPTWGYYTTGEESGAFIYGAEYETRAYSNKWGHLHNNDVPCIVCRVPHSDVLMVPGSAVCPKSYTLQYDGYLMTGHHNQPGSSEYICVDCNPETINRGFQDKDGYLLYFVQAQCGSLSCGPYVQNREVTCAVCSFSPNTDATNI